MINKSLLKILILLCISTSVSAQANVDSVDAKVNKLGKFIEVLRKFRFSGYIQMQYQHADTAGATSYSGGDFAPASNNRFMLRRARLRVAFEHVTPKGVRLIETVFFTDATDRGFVIKDIYGRLTEPFTGWFGIQGGYFMRPFGFEVNYPSLLRETPDRGRMSQILMPGERDLGAALIIESPNSFKPVYVRLDAGVFNGTGAFSEIDNRKDFISHLQLRKVWGTKTTFTISGGASYYRGSVLHSTPFVYSLQNDSSGTLRYSRLTDSAGVGKKYSLRQYIGADAQLVLDYAIGTTTLRGEFITGTEPGTATASATPTATGSDIYERKFSGAYFYFIQTFKHKIMKQPVFHDLVFKYDYYDPNIRIAGKDLSQVNDARVSKADVRYQTFTVAYSFRPADWFKLMLSYDYVINETTNISGYNRNLKDNVFTLRTQFAFDSKWFTK
jgi:hypothetical protein